MKDRLIDTSLLVALILVAIAIIWTLLGSFGISLNNFSGSARPATEQNQTESETQNPENGIISITPAETTNPSGNDAIPSSDLVQHTTDASGNVLVIDPSEETNTENVDSNSELSVPSAAEEEAITEGISVEDSPDIIAVPEGAIELERIGFSYVTGSVGACNITLEPWKHIAVSRDIRETYPCGSELTVRFETPIDGRSSFSGIVADTMNPSKVKTVNVYVETQELALAYGITDGILEP